MALGRVQAALAVALAVCAHGSRVARADPPPIAADASPRPNLSAGERARRDVHAAYTMAKTMRADRDPKAAEWCRRTVNAFDRYAARAPGVVGGPEADLAAECAFNELDDRIRAEFDYETGHHRYAGQPNAVLKKFDDDLARASATYAKDLERIGARFGSKTWTAAALAREGSLYDSCRTGLYNAAPALKIHVDARGPEFGDCWGSGGWNHPEDERDQRERLGWQEARNAKLEVADAPMIQLYARAFLAARSSRAPSAAVELALRRLGFFEDILGEAKVRRLTRGLEDPATRRSFVYADGMFRRARPGRLFAIDVDPLPLPEVLPGH